MLANHNRAALLDDPTEQRVSCRVHLVLFMLYCPYRPFGQFLTVPTVSVFSQCVRVSMWWVLISPDYENLVLLNRKKEMALANLIFWVCGPANTPIYIFHLCLFLLRYKTPTFRIQTVKKASRIFWSLVSDINFLSTLHIMKQLSC